MTREEAIEQLQICKDLIKQDGQDYLDERDFPLLDMAIEALQDRPTGVWVDTGKYSECSECGEVAQRVELRDGVYERLTNFCPNCGARMI